MNTWSLGSRKPARRPQEPVDCRRLLSDFARPKSLPFWSFAPAVQAVKDGTMTATLGVDLTSAGKELIDQIPDIIKAGDAWQPKSFIPGYTIVTKENVDQVLKNAPK